MTSSYSPVLTTKAVKDEYEQRILRDAHVRPLHTDKHAHMSITHVDDTSHAHTLTHMLSCPKALQHV